MAVDAISSLNSLTSVGSLNSVLQSGNSTNGLNQNDTPAVSFTDYLKNALNQVNGLQMDAEQAANDFAAGKTDNIQDVTVAAEKADIALQLTLQIRSKILDAYNEIMRMQI